MNRTVNTLSARLSLRKPQRDSLEILAEVLEQIELSKDTDLQRPLEIIQGQYPSVTDFERNFPSLCFALATGVGKTRLMGAFIAYLYLTHRSRNFFVLAPNLTIYEKLIGDFSPQSPKYVFKGVSEFAHHQPVIVTGDTYDKSGSVRSDLFGDDETPYISIFNISKINATENRAGAVRSKTPRVKRLQEYIGESYFGYLAGLPDLVILMDEAHRYRASAGAAAINELKPLLGLELTATPKTVGAKSQPFKNVVYHYPLAEALQDGFVKDPAVATRKDFKPDNYTPEQLERIKLEDGIHHHEFVKVELETYARSHNAPRVKPFMLAVAQDTQHAGALRNLIASDDFFEGRYRDKVIEVHSNLRGEESDENMQRLLSVEHNAATEIVIHVNKLKEGWDVTNLYTIVPLRASASEILTEQTIGRGLRLPYGKRTGVEAVDRLTIIAHDKFQEIIDQANNPDSIIRKTVEIGEGGDVPEGRPLLVEAPSLAETLLTGQAATIDGRVQDIPGTYAIGTPEGQRIARITLDVLKRYEGLSNSSELKNPEVRQKVAAEVREILASAQPELAGMEAIPERSIEQVVETVTAKIAELTIDIPSIVLLPTREVTFGFRDFDLTGLEAINYQPVRQDILIQHLRTHQQAYITWNGNFAREEQLENYLVRALVDHDAIDYDQHADLLYKLAGQMVNRLQSYLGSREDVESVLMYYQKSLADFIFVQMKDHMWETPTDYRVNFTKGFSLLRPNSFTLAQGERPRHFREPIQDKKAIKRMVFNGFAKCCYPLQKFDSVDGEWRLVQILEDDPAVLRWMKPASGHFRIEYRSGVPYEPDFVVETRTEKLIIEPKRRDELDDMEVQVKTRAAVRWCRHATGHARQNGGKPWSYLLVPHDAIRAGWTVEGLKAEFLLE